MDSFYKLLGGGPKRKQPPLVETDEVLPVPFFDDTALNRGVILHVTFRFSDVLNTAKLEGALSELLSMDGWKKLGGRFRLNSVGRLELHVPQQFSDERPPVRFMTTTYGVAIDEHPLASQLPQYTQSRPFTQPGPATFLPLMKTDGTPTTIEDLIYSDSPQISVRVLEFTDGTLLSLSWPHVTTDIIGMSAIIDAWSLILAGRKDEVPEFQPVENDPFDTLNTTEVTNEVKREQDHLASRALGMFKAICLAVYFLIIDPWLYGPMVEKSVCVPKPAVQKLKEYASSTPSSAKGDDDKKTSNSFRMSEGDVITAWFVALASSVLGPASNRSVLMMSPFDIRSRLPQVFPGFPSKTIYVQNAVLNFFYLAPSREVAPAASDFTKLGAVASGIRQAIRQQTTVPHVYALAHAYRKALSDKLGMSPMFGDTTSFAMLYSNWTKARLFERVDFGPAVVSAGANRSSTQETAGITEPGHPNYLFSQSLLPGHANRNCLCFNGMPTGDYWVHGTLTRGTWDKVEDGIEQLLADDA